MAVDMSQLLDLHGVEAIRDWVKANFIGKNDADGTMASKLKITFDPDFEGQPYTITGGANESYTGTVPASLIVEQTIKPEGLTTYTISATAAGAERVTKATQNVQYFGVYPVNLVRIVSWAEGTDEQIAAMIDAARSGTIDLQRDGGWAVGDKRTITVSAFSAESTTSYAQQNITIAISSFDDYNGCGAVMQFDFCDLMTAAHTDSSYVGTRMNPTNSNAGGYGASEMYMTTLPALANALPEWLKTRLLEFSVLASAGSQSGTINTVAGNKLALRSEVEIFGATPNSKPGEGSQIPYYAVAANRVKKRGETAITWWERSPWSNGIERFCYVLSSGTADSGKAGNTNGLAPFGCI